MSDDFGLFDWDEAQFRRLPPQRQKELEAKLGQLRDAFDQFPFWKYAPHERQKLFHASIGIPIRAFVAGNRTGKSHAGVMDDLIQCVDADVLPPWLAPYKRWAPPFHMRIVTPDLTTTGEGVIIEKLMAFTPRSQLVGDKWDKAYNERRRRLSFKNGSWIEFLSTAQELDKHGGSALHRVHFDEEPFGNRGRQIFTEALTRTIDFGGEIVFTMTPLLGLSWTYDVLTHNDRPRNDDEVFVVTADMDDNPHLDERTKQRVLAMYPEQERIARKTGRWVALQGLIYPEFSLERHVVPQAEIPRLPNGEAAVEVYVGIDPGLRYMAGVVYCWVEPDGTMVVFDEIPAEGKTVEAVANLIHSKNELLGVKPRWYVIDPAGRNKIHQTGRSDQDEYRRHGIYAVPGQNAHRAGFNTVKERLEADPPKLLVTANCEVLIDQFRRYAWKKPSRGDQDAKEEPIKRDDHLLDALRYVCMSRPLAPHEKDPEPEPLDAATRAFRHSISHFDRPRSEHPLGGIYY
jgi:phage terminase large subunit-like protein